MEELVFLKNEQALTDSLTVAEMFDKRHDNVMQAIEKLIEGINLNEADSLLKNKETNERKIASVNEPKNRSVNVLKNKVVKSEQNSAQCMFFKTRYKDEKGEFRKKYLMNRDGFSLLVMGFTGKKALQWKLKYIEAFNAMEKIITEKVTTAWIETREQSKITRKAETDVLQELVEYAKEQGSTHSDRLYMIYTKLAHKMAKVTNRDEATQAQLNDLSMVERLITKVVLDGMKEGVYYKQIYQNSKERLDTVYGWLPEEMT